MYIHWLQHVPFEGLGTIEQWAVKNGHTLERTRLWANETLPDPEEVRMLIIMGGAMGVHDAAAYPWLVDEKRFIRAVVDRDRPVLGVCLGAQLLADQLGAKVYANREKEIGWFAIQGEEGLPGSNLVTFPEQMIVFHWHGDTFDIPAGAVWLASSSGCRHQAFAVDERIIGLQFHLEMTPEGIAALADNCRDELQPGRWVQAETELPGRPEDFRRCQGFMEQLLDVLSKNIEHPD
jgi:GMP synthase-like glutamine amidotransferase